ncbi:MAG: histidine phosphatase family protein [Spirochaetia bacterium]|nr:histidine phosphatase family protein [Spirochaetia bacterium]
MRIYLIRHADPDYAKDNLTEAGHLEAQALARRMEREGLTHLFTSPLGRARATMRYTAERTGLPHEVLPWTRELGIQAPPHHNVKLAAWDLHGEILRRQLHRHDPKNGDLPEALEAPEIRETLAVIRENSDRFFAGLGYEREDGVYRVKKPNTHRIALFCHGGFGLTWLSILLELPLSLTYAGFFLPPSSVTTILMDERSSDFATPRVIGMGDVSHLYEAGLPVQPSGIKANFY